MRTKEEKALARKLYNSRPDVKAKKREYDKEYEKKRPYRSRKGRKQSDRKRNTKNPIFKRNLNKIGITDLYLYFIQVKGTNIYKIGITNNPFKRVEVLQTGCPFDIELRMAFVVTNAAEIEQKIHSDLSQFHRRGEWFNVSYDHLQRIKSELQ